MHNRNRISRSDPWRESWDRDRGGVGSGSARSRTFPSHSLNQRLLPLTAPLPAARLPSNPSGSPQLNPVRLGLGSEIQTWVSLTGTPIESVHAFDDEDNAAPFARLLARLRRRMNGSSAQSAAETKAQVSSVIQAIANDAELRTQVFSIAEDALGACDDRLAEGFSSIRMAVDNHRMAKAVENGQINAKQLGDWAESLFRLSLLESAVNHFIHTQLENQALSGRDRDLLTTEPVETMLHAKIALREPLGLPDSTASEMTYRSLSILRKEDLRTLEERVKAQAEDSITCGMFLLKHPTWRAGMKALHAQEFKDLKIRQEADPFFDLDVPTDLEGAAEYSAQARLTKAKHDDQEDALLRHLAGLPPLGQIAGSSSSSTSLKWISRVFRGRRS